MLEVRDDSRVKRCGGCKRERPEGAARATCDVCLVKVKAYYHAHREARMAKARAWKAVNKDKISSQRQRWRAANKDRITEQDRVKAKRNKERFSVQAPNYSAYKTCPRCKITARTGDAFNLNVHQADGFATWCKACWRVKNSRRKRYPNKSRYKISPQLEILVFETKGGACLYCGDRAVTVDHIFPRVLGGLDDMDNLAPACMTCQNSKGRKTLEEWVHRPVHRRTGHVNSCPSTLP